MQVQEHVQFLQAIMTPEAAAANQFRGAASHHARMLGTIKNRLVQKVARHYISGMTKVDVWQ